ncbi:hypothetical protein HZC35_02625 [Candidatus Saganbacteria bacterium]|nr:hypothetical protein [Candidatus Saganbacteria bacterium]
MQIVESGFLPVEVEYPRLFREATSPGKNLIAKAERFASAFERAGRGIADELFAPFDRGKFLDLVQCIEIDARQKHLPLFHRVIEKIMRDYPDFDVAFILRGTEGLYLAFRTYLQVRQIQKPLYVLRISTPLYESRPRAEIERFAEQEYLLPDGFATRRKPILCIDTFFQARILAVVPADAKLLFCYRSPDGIPKPDWLDTAWEDVDKPATTIAELANSPLNDLMLLEKAPRNLPKTTHFTAEDGRLFPDYDVDYYLKGEGDRFLSFYWQEVLKAWAYNIAVIRSMLAR